MKIIFRSFIPSAILFPEMINPFMYKSTFQALKKRRNSRFIYKEDYLYSEIVNGEYIMRSFDGKEIKYWLVELRIIDAYHNKKEVDCIYKDEVSLMDVENNWDAKGLINDIFYYARKHSDLKKL